VAKKIIHPEDSELFRQTIGKVRSVKKDKILLKQHDKPKPYPKPLPGNPYDRLNKMIEADIEPLGIEDSLKFSNEGVEKNILKKLQQGYFGLDAEIDLHGLNSHEAKRQLLGFLHECVKEGYRCIHIVHGKGYRSPENYPVLKNNLNLWLRQHKDVQAFCSAPPKEGGTGAVFVLLYLS